MMTVRRLFAVVTVVIASGSLAHAQAKHIVDRPTIANIVEDHAAAAEADRAAVRAALTRPDVQAVAAQLGVDVAQIQGRLDTLNGSALNNAANRARQLNDSLVGGASTVIISTTAIIVALLIVLIVVLVA